MDNYLASLLYSPQHVPSVPDIHQFYLDHSQEENPHDRNLGCEYLSVLIWALGLLFANVPRSFSSSIHESYRFRRMSGVKKVPRDQTYADAVARWESQVARYSIERAMEDLNLTAVVDVYLPEKVISGLTAFFNLPGLVMPAGWWSKVDAVQRRDPRECTSEAKLLCPT